MKKALLVLLCFLLCVQLVSAVCTDSDGGLDFEVKGVVTLTGKFAGTSEDSCGGNRLEEMYCNKYGGISADYYQCPIKCEDGACVDVDVPVYDDIIEKDIGQYSLSEVKTDFMTDYTLLSGRYTFDDFMVDVEIFFPSSSSLSKDLEPLTIGDYVVYRKEYADMRGQEQTYYWFSGEKRVNIHTWGGGAHLDLEPVVTAYLEKLPSKDLAEPEPVILEEPVVPEEPVEPAPEPTAKSEATQTVADEVVLKSTPSRNHVKPPFFQRVKFWFKNFFS